MMLTDVMLNFRAALLAIIPMAEAVGLPWKRGDAYDEWDELANCMYRQLVGSLLPMQTDRHGRVIANLPAYDMLYGEYGQYATIEVRNIALGPGRWVFHAFGTSQTPLDIVEVRELDANSRLCSEELATCPVSDSVFSVRWPDGSVTDQVLV